MNIQKVIQIVVVGLAVALFVGWYGTRPPKENNLILGVIGPFSGPVASMGEEVKNSLELAHVKNFRILYADNDGCDSKKSLSAYQSLKLQGVKLFYAPCSGSVMALAPLLRKNHDLLLTGYAGSAEIRKLGTEKIRFIPDALSIVDALVKYATDYPTQKYAILFEKQDYAQSVADNLTEKLGDRIVTREGYSANETVFGTILAKIAQTKPNRIIFIPVSDKTARLVLTEMKRNKMATPILGDVNLCDYPFTLTEFGLSGVCWKAYLDTMEAREFEHAYELRYGTKANYAFYDGVTYDIGIILDELLTGVSYIDERTIATIQKDMLAGVSGKVSSYEFSSSGEVLSGKYLKQVEF